MADTKITGLATASSLAAADLFAIADDPAGAVASRSIRADAIRTYTSTFYDTTAAETAASVTPTDKTYPPGDVRRYGTNTTPGTTNMSVALQAALDQNNQGGPAVIIPAETVAFATTLNLYSQSQIIGMGKQQSIMSYTGSAQAFVNATPSSRIYEVGMRDFTLSDIGTGTIGLDLQRVSSSNFERMVITGFTTDVEIDSPTSGHAVYNRFYDVTASTATTGFLITGTSSNANTFLACRTNVCTTGAQIDDSNENHFSYCQMESGGAGTAFKVTASGAGLSPSNEFNHCRIEGYTSTGYDIGTNASDTQIIGPIFLGTLPTNPLIDNGLRTMIKWPNGSVMGSQEISALANTIGTPWLWERTTNGGSNVPMVKFVDSNTGSGTPTTVQIESGRTLGHAIRVLDGVGGTESFGIEARGRIRTNQDTANTNTPAGATAHQLPIYNESGTLLGYIPVYGAAW